MTRAASSAYLGGIGLMLEVAHICPRCGKHVPDAPSAAARHLASNTCRPPVYAALPEPEPAAQEDEGLIPAGRLIRDYETPLTSARRTVPLGALDPISTPAPAPRGLAIPWLRPPDLGEVL
jgi:hypothetical protein